jgi:hypothetical protein
MSFTLAPAFSAIALGKISKDSANFLMLPGSIEKFLIYILY